MQFPLFANELKYSSEPMISMYVIANENNGKLYIGSARNTYSRLATHRTLLNKGKHYCLAMQKDYDAGHGFIVTIYITDSREYAYDLEQSEFNKRKGMCGLYNQARDARLPKKGLTVKESTKNLLRQAALRYYDLIGRKGKIRRTKAKNKSSNILRYTPLRFVPGTPSPIIVDGVRYSSMAEAAKILGIKERIVRMRVRSKKSAFSAWNYL